MNDALTTAFAFIQKGIDSGNPVDPMKLQKLLYFAHGSSLAVHEKPLFPETFNAWRYGPVIKEVYNAYKAFGASPVKADSWFFSYIQRDISKLTAEEIWAIDYTWRSLSKVNAIALSNWSHEKGSPWDKHYHNTDLGDSISNEEIKQYFKKILYPKK